MPVKIVAFVTPKPGREAELEAAVRTAVAGARGEPGNLRYDAWREKGGERIVIDELYKDHDAVEAHRNAPHYVAFRATAADLLAGPPEVTVVEEIDVAA
ncbi:putative quinol monooxygenase [Sphingomonas sp. PR090111-T3T-6A]|uniref:putative quinol monooxygenase n=1 Tax=Sphingomonas sp. PR090111-T3T-6A TaxID=685778 RepID=UPI000365D2A7|nr:putative quinol monooxygenase [Sphingomonas sp. PR090111-T3T-6A]